FLLQTSTLSAGRQEGEPGSESRRRDRASRVVLPIGEFERWRSRAPAIPGEIGPLEEEPERFVIQVLFAESLDGLDIVTYSVPKTPLESWWAAHAIDYDEATVRAVASDAFLLRTAAPESALSDCLPGDSWDNGILDGLP